MKTIGLLGGMSWESSILYYKIINEQTNAILGFQNNAKSIMFTVNFNEIEKLQHQNKWDEACDILIDACKVLENSGASFIVLCTNTMHKLLPEIQKKINIPFLHIAKATLTEIKEKKITKVALLGTRFTMEDDFYKKILINEGIEVVIPNKKDIDIIHHIIYNELCLGKIKNESKKEFLRIIESMKDVQGVILGCTEITMLVSQSDLDIVVFDTTRIHAVQAVNMALSK